MKTRFLKKQLYASSVRHIKDKSPSTETTTEISTEVQESAEINESAEPPEPPKPRANPFELLFKEITPIPEIIEESPEPKKRGRPRKIVDLDGSQTKKIDDEDEPREITQQMKNQMVEEFHRSYIVNQDPLNPTLQKIATRYRITYAQAYKTLENEL